MYSNEEKAIILATQAIKLGIAAIITFLLLPVSMICCIDGYYKAKKAKTLAPKNGIVKSAWLIVNISRWVLFAFLAALLLLSFYMAYTS